MNKIKNLWRHYLALLIVLLLLVFPITWFYQFTLKHFGGAMAIISLALLIISALILAMRGAVHTSQIHLALRRQMEASNSLSSSTGVEKPMICRVFDMDLHPHTIADCATAEIDTAQVNQEIQKLLDRPRKYRGKQSRFPETQIRKAVLRWESREPSLSAVTLEEFLEQEFGGGPDGILLMAPTTFYDWRRRILKEIEAQRPPSLESGVSPIPESRKQSSRI